MVIDSTAVIAILHGEPEAHAFVIKLAAATKCRLSAANYVEAGLVLRRDATGAARRALETLLADFQIVIEPVSANQAKLALAAYDRFGKETGHSAGLNGLAAGPIPREIQVARHRPPADAERRRIAPVERPQPRPQRGNGERPHDVARAPRVEERRRPPAQPGSNGVQTDIPGRRQPTGLIVSVYGLCCDGRIRRFWCGPATTVLFARRFPSE